jgi:hypothetical protein
MFIDVRLLWAETHPSRLPGRVMFDLSQLGHLLIPLLHISAHEVEDPFQWWNEDTRDVIIRVKLKRSGEVLR